MVHSTVENGRIVADHDKFIIVSVRMEEIHDSLLCVSGNIITLLRGNHTEVIEILTLLLLFEVLSPASWTPRLLFSLAAVRPRAQISLAAFMALGAVVRICFIWVASKRREAEVVAGRAIQGAYNAGTESMRCSSSEKPGAVSY